MTSTIYTNSEHSVSHYASPIKTKIAPLAPKKKRKSQRRILADETDQRSLEEHIFVTNRVAIGHKRIATHNELHQLLPADVSKHGAITYNNTDLSIEALATLLDLPPSMVQLVQNSLPGITNDEFLDLASTITEIQSGEEFVELITFIDDLKDKDVPIILQQTEQQRQQQQSHSSTLTRNTTNNHTKTHDDGLRISGEVAETMSSQTEFKLYHVQY